MNNRLEGAQEKYLEDKLDFEDDKNVKDESIMKIDILEMNLQDQKMTGNNIDIRTKLDQVLKVLPNLSQMHPKFRFFIAH